MNADRHALLAALEFSAEQSRELECLKQSNREMRREMEAMQRQLRDIRDAAGRGDRPVCNEASCPQGMTPVPTKKVRGDF